MNIAEFSPCRKYRYTLWRHWGGMFNSGYVNFICLNPSTADETRDDNTIRKCIKFARTWGYESLCVTNIFAWRDTDPKKMKAAAEPIGEDNDKWIAEIAVKADLVIASWGLHGRHMFRSTHILKLLETRPKILRMGAVEPWHPLYLPDSSIPIEWPNLEQGDNYETTTSKTSEG